MMVVPTSIDILPFFSADKSARVAFPPLAKAEGLPSFRTLYVLVRRYNNQVFELGRKRDPVFTVEDVEAVINNTEFFTRGRYYFEGVWNQAKQGAKGQQAILRVLAPHPEGLSYEDAIAEVSTEGFDEQSLQEAINTLQRHDVVEENQGRLCIIVELFRLWLVKHK